MTKKSVCKLQKAGYVFLRYQEGEGERGKKKHIIKQSKEFGTWIYLAIFDTKAACDRALNELEEDPFMIIENFNH